MKKLLLVSLTLQLALIGCTVDNPVDNPVKDLSTQEAFDEYKSISLNLKHRSVKVRSTECVRQCLREPTCMCIVMHYCPSWN